MKKIYKKQVSFVLKNIIRALAICLFISFKSFTATAQCPPNIDFEQGDFTGWECWVGNVDVFNFTNRITWNPILPVQPSLFPTRFQMLSSATGNGLDPYGGFPRNCPNGSGYSIQLGNNQSGAEAEGVSYTFTIPAGQNQFNLIYHYAVIFQGPIHENYEQPRMVIDIYNLTDSVKIDCASFEFFKDVNNTLPGFFLSPNPGGNTPVWCKNWSAASIKLDGQAGKTIQLFFKTTDCTRTGHFGYAYIDVNTECSSSFIGAAYCPDDTTVNVTAPFGYQFYQWWDIANPAVILGNTQTINFTPPPPSGMTLQVALEPYDGYGCPDTLTVQLLDTLNVFANAGPDMLSCQNAPVQLGMNPTPGFVYSWSPITGLNNPNISNPIATLSVTTQYVLTVRNSGGGCLTTDTVIVNAAVLDNSITQSGISSYCLGDPQSAILKVNPADSIQWYRNNVAIPGANDTIYNVGQTGTYHATVFSFVGCSLSTSTINITVNPTPVVGFTRNSIDQCFNNHQFIFTDTSSIAFGTLQYNWDLGDGNTATTQNVTHSYTLPGSYIVKLTVTSDQGCIDSASYTVRVFDSPVTGFDSNIKELCFKNNQFVFTNSSTLAVGAMQYNWNMGDGNSYTTRDVTHSYISPGTYTVRLTTTSDKGCADDSAFDITVNPEPVVGFTIANPQQCFGGNQFDFINTTTISLGTLQYRWYLGDGNTDTTRNVTHSYAVPGDYIVKMVATSDKGCRDSTTFNVKVFKYAVADFYVEPACINLRLPITNKTINTAGMPLNFLWDFGNGQTSSQINPVYSYPVPGTYTIKLTVNSNLCPTTITEKQQDVVIDAPSIPLRYTDETAVMNFPEQLGARQIGTSVLWTPSISLDNATSFRPYFKGLSEQLYKIQIKSATGCVTVDTQLVKIRKKIEIYVPTSFTPDGNGLNEHLRPVLMGFKTVNYFRVYNRWGKLLYQMQSDLPGWDGRINGVRQELQTVVWMIEAIDVDGVKHNRQGTSILLR